MNKKTVKRVESSCHCLFCLGDCSSFEASLNIPGAGGCEQLGKQLQQMFIAQKLLDMPREWCEVTLTKKQKTSCEKEKVKEKSECHEDDGNDDEEEVEGGEVAEEQLLQQQHQWFTACTKCSKMILEPAWEAYLKLVAAESKIREIKEQVRETTKERILLKLRHKRWCGLKGDGVDVEIRNWIFPDLLTKRKNDLDQVEGSCTNTRRRRPQVSYQEDKDDSYPVLDSPQLQDVDDDMNIEENDMDWKPTSDLDNHSDVNEADEPPSPLELSQKAAPKKRKRTKRKKPSSQAVSPPKKRVRIRKPRRRPENLKRFKCLECGCYFNTADELKIHVEAHEQSKQNGGGPHDCEKCSYPAQTPKELEMHMKKRHGRVRSHHCPKCGVRIKSWSKLKIYLTTVHAADMTEEDLENPKMSLKCPVCSRQFVRLESMMNHQRKMHPELFGGDSEEPVECQECGRKFPSKITLSHHMNNVHTERSLKFVCEECGKGFEWKSHLERHRKAFHLGKTRRDYVCHLCGLDYSYPELLTSHYRKAHPGETEAGGVKKDNSSTSSVKEFKCRYCELSSPYKGVIQRHLEMHKQEVGFRCDECGKYYMTEQSLQRHVSINHPTSQESVPCPHCLKPFTSSVYMKHHVVNFCRVKDKNKEQQQAPSSSSSYLLEQAEISLPHPPRAQQDDQLPDTFKEEFDI